MLDVSLFERAICWAASEPRAPNMAQARADFERRTGAIENAAADYEARIAHFFEHALCSLPGPSARPPLALFAADTPLSESARQELAGWLRSHRSLFRFEGGAQGSGWLRDRIGGALFRFEQAGGDRELRAGDCFDGRLVPIGTRLWLTPARVFHPQEAGAAIEQLLVDARERDALDASLLDPMLRMRSRFLSFESIRAEHVYRFDAVHAETLAAPWAQRGQAYARSELESAPAALRRRRARPKDP